MRLYTGRGVIVYRQAKPTRRIPRHSDSPTMRIMFIKAMPYDSQSSADMVCSIGSRGYRYIGSHTAKIAEIA